MILPPDQAPPSPSEPRPPTPRPIFGERAPETALRVAFVVAFVWLARKLAVPVILGGIAAVMLHPVHVRLAARSRYWAKFSPYAITTAIVIVILGPVTGVAWKAVLTANDLITGTTIGDITSFGERMIRRLGRSIGADEAELEMLRSSAADSARQASEAIGRLFASLVGAVPLYVTYIFLMTLALFYGLRDGGRLVEWFRRISPVGPGATEELFSATERAIRGAVLGMFVVALVQGGIALIALLALRVPGAVLWGVLAALFSILPVVGTAPVTMGAAIYLFVVDRPVASGVMIATGLFIGGIDNVIRPYVQGTHDRVHPFVELVAIFGGIVVLGLSGLFIGPVLAAMALWAVNTWRKRPEVLRA